MHSKTALGLLVGLRVPPRRAFVSVLAFLGACVYMAPVPPGGGTPVAPVPDVIKTYPWMADVRWPPGSPRPSSEEQMEIASDIDQLLTGDFDVYPVAARRLIHRGDVVLPCLGQAAEKNHAPAVRKERLAIVLGPLLRETPEDRMLGVLASPYPTVRAAGAAAVGERHVESLGLRLIALLEDPDIRVRRAAITSLRMITGEFIEYRPDDRPAERAAAAARWEEFWQRHR